jgi:hypothetical protein
MTQEDSEDMRQLRVGSDPVATEMREPSADEMAKIAEDGEDYRMIHGNV